MTHHKGIGFGYHALGPPAKDTVRCKCGGIDTTDSFIKCRTFVCPLCAEIYYDKVSEG